MLERFTNPDELNIKNISVESEEESGLPFDVEKEITEEDSQGMHDFLDKLRQEGLWEGFATLASRVEYLGREVSLSGADREALEDELAKKRSMFERGIIGTMMEFMSDIKSIGIEVELTDQERQGFEESLQAALITSDYFDFADVASRVRKLDMDISVPDQFRDALNNLLTRVRQQGALTSTSNLGYGLAADLKDLGWEITLNEEEWLTAEGELSQLRQKGGWPMFAQLASDLKTLSAVEPQQHPDTTPPLPEARSF